MTDPLPKTDYTTFLPVELWYTILLLHCCTPSGARDIPSLSVSCARFRAILEPLRFRELKLTAWSPRKAAKDAEYLKLRPERFDFVRSMTFHGPSTSTYRPLTHLSNFLLFGLLKGDVETPGCRIKNLKSLHLSKCHITTELLEGLQGFPKLSTLYLAFVAVCRVPENADHLGLRLSELRLVHVESERGDLTRLASILAGPAIRSLYIKNQLVPKELLSTLTRAILPSRIETLVIEDVVADLDDLHEFFEAQDAVRSLTYMGCFSFSRLSPAAMPNLEQCITFGTDPEFLLRGRPVQCTTLALVPKQSKEGDGDGDEYKGALELLARSPRSLVDLTLVTKEFGAALFEEIVRTCPKLTSLTIISTFGATRVCIFDLAEDGTYLTRKPEQEFIETELISKIASLRFLSTLSFLREGVPSHCAPGFSHFRTAKGQIELRWQHEQVRALEERCPSLRQVNVRPVSWVWIGRGEWRPYPDNESEWDVPIELDPELDGAKDSV